MGSIEWLIFHDLWLGIFLLCAIDTHLLSQYLTKDGIFRIVKG